jgi:hypothetical protein
MAVMSVDDCLSTCFQTFLFNPSCNGTGCSKLIYIMRHGKVYRTYHPFNRAGICKRLRRPGIGSEESISQANVAWRASTTNRVVVPAESIRGRLKRFKNTGLRSSVLSFTTSRNMCMECGPYQSSLLTAVKARCFMLT